MVDNMAPIFWSTTQTAILLDIICSTPTLRILLYGWEINLSD